MCAACHASAVIQGTGGRRTVPMEEFHVGPYETAVGDAEMLVEVRMPLRSRPGSAYEKVERRAGDWAVAAAGAAVWMEDGKVAECGIGLAAVGSNALRAHRAEDVVRGQAPSDDLFEEAGRLAAEDCSPTTDQRGSAEYKRHLAAVLTKRSLRRAVERVTH